MDILQELYDVVEDRRKNPQEGSYTCYLLEAGMDKILKKVGEECAETIIAAKNDQSDSLAGEVADLMYHLTVMLSAAGLPWETVREELVRRTAKIGNLKHMRQTDIST